MLRKIATPFVLVAIYILFLLLLSGNGILEATYSISRQVNSAESSYRLVDDALETIRLNIYKVAVAARDGLLSQRPQDGRVAIAEYEREIKKQIQFLLEVTPAENKSSIQRIDDDVHAYMKTIHSVTDQANSMESQRQLASILDRRQTIVDISAALSKWNDADLEAEQKTISESLGSLRSEIIATLAVLLLLGAAAATAAWFRIQRIQKCNQEAHEKIAEAREQLKSLSRQLVSTQEAERKALSRELHDVIGQSLTALKLELAKAEKIARNEESAATSHLQAIREVADQTLRATKTISLGLRPPMLDDLGLLSALNWLIAEFSRRTGIAVDFTADGTVSQLGEDHRTCVYRIVQEALTNCARHSQARSIGLKLDVGEELLALTVADDGVGFDIRKQTGAGLGLLSMQERAAELGGRFEIDSVVGRGTTIRIAIPTATIAV